MSFNGDLYPSAGATSVLTTKGDMVDFDTARQRFGIGSTGQVLTVTAGLPVWEDAGDLTHNVVVTFACGDETTALSAGQVISFRMPFAMTLNAGILGVKGSLVTAGTGVNLVTCDVNEAGATILSTKLTFDATETTSVSASTPVVISDVNLASDAIITVDVDQVDSGGVGAGLKISLIGSLL